MKIAQSRKACANIYIYDSIIEIEKDYIHVPLHSRGNEGSQDRERC